MSFKSLFAATALGSALFLGGCSINIAANGEEFEEDWRTEQRLNRNYINQLALNVPMEVITSELGNPAMTEAFQRDGSEYQIRFYRTHHEKSDGQTTMDETTPLVFRDGLLVGWGHGYYQRLVHGGEA